mmetsp:Transcript_2963/g.4516  ORF Transcript_2963/g.4516 Transcript_2963/m.4516 type:complete len:262 (+) Transcript_2963:73-858(+)|eukprot:CAMPEP_0184671310 /NCGR_PEP_ID=MMETSP0308-20130426/85409_1 /TAXON_ID=38269 /ORGANISM="Gloeochaete witrockiana, Strain SAG 46.84" /LENGTH=261 /DNA_ID=CAMNT_0027118401 /DNA_START=47 /DNA_END=832 /DNA_ORIENTATION=+
MNGKVTFIHGSYVTIGHNTRPFFHGSRISSSSLRETSNLRSARRRFELSEGGVTFGKSLTFDRQVPQHVCLTFDEVRELLSADRQGERLRGLREAKSLPPEQALDILAEAVTNDKSQVRNMALGMLADFGHVDMKRTAELLYDRLENETELSAKSTAADSIAALRLEGAFDALVQVFQESKDWVVRMSIIAAMGELADPRAFDLLAQVIREPNTEELISIAAIGAIGDLGDKRALQILAPLANHPDDQIRQRAQQSIQSLQ